MPGNNFTYINTGVTTIISGTAIKRVNIQGIFIIGTLLVKSGTTTIGSFAIGTPVGTYWFTSCYGTEVADAQFVTSAADDITVSWNNL
jgi:hypothetical protein